MSKTKSIMSNSRSIKIVDKNKWNKSKLNKRHDTSYCNLNGYNNVIIENPDQHIRIGYVNKFNHYEEISDFTIINHLSMKGLS